MFIQSIANACCERSACRDNTAKTVDWIVALALLIIGILSATGILHLSPALTYSFIGAGAVYTLAMILTAGIDIHVKCKK